MKLLLILRHAKSSWADPNLPDFDRPLNDRGLNNAPFMGEVIAERGYIAERMLVSPAARTVQTAALVREGSGMNAEVQYDERIYEASAQRLAKVISETDDAVNTLMVVGHNPACTGIVGLVTGSDEEYLPTCGFAAIEIDGTWLEILENKCRLLEIIRPKEESARLAAFLRSLFRFVNI